MRRNHYKCAIYFPLYSSTQYFNSKKPIFKKEASVFKLFIIYILIGILNVLKVKAMAASILKTSFHFQIHIKVIFIYVVESSHANVDRRIDFNSIKVFLVLCKKILTSIIS